MSGVEEGLLKRGWGARLIGNVIIYEEGRMMRSRPENLDEVEWMEEMG